MDIKLRLINRSNDTNNSDVLVFQKNVASDFEEIAVAWRVIRYLGRSDYHPFILPMNAEVSVSDSWGNYTPHLKATEGQLFAMELTSSGNVLRYIGPSNNPTEIHVENRLPKGSINVNIFKANQLLAQKTYIAPGQKAIFEFNPTLWLGAVSQIEEGQAVNSAIISDINTELSLVGISKADIIMTGGGPGHDSTPFTFTLANVTMT